MENKMSHHGKFQKESQDARRHDKHSAAHPDEKLSKVEAKAKHLREKKARHVK